MSPDLLRETGEALFGSRWQTELAEALGINDRTLRRWHSGQNTCPPWLAEELAAICKERGAALSAIAERLTKVAAETIVEDSGR